VFVVVFAMVRGVLVALGRRGLWAGRAKPLWSSAEER
jgi:hypothetical protein